MRCNVSVTFEFTTRAPQTAKVMDVEAGGVQTIAARAVREARKTLKPINWTSAVILVERLDSSETEEEGEED
jgi:hypothetical protein